MSGSAHTPAGGSKSWFGSFDGHAFKTNIRPFLWPFFVVVAILMGSFLIIIMTGPPKAPVYGKASAQMMPAATAFSPTGQCDYSHKRLELGSEPVAFNPGARCAYRFTVKEGAVEFDGPDGKTMVEPNTLVDMHSWDETVRAVNGHAVFLYQLYPAAG